VSSRLSPDLFELRRFTTLGEGATCSAVNGGLDLRVSGRPWAVAVVWAPRLEALGRPNALWEPVEIRGSIIVDAGEIALALVARDERTDIDQVVLEASAMPQTFSLNAMAVSDVSCLMLKAGERVDPPGRARFLGLEAVLTDTHGESSLHAFYDLDWMPTSFDFATFLMAAEMARARDGLASIEVVLVPGRHDGVRRETEPAEAALSRSSRRWRIDNLLIPLAGFLPSVGSVERAASRSAGFARAQQAGHIFPERPSFRGLSLAQLYQRVTPHLKDAAGALRFRAPEQGKMFVAQWLEAHMDGRKPVVITLRHSPKAPERNSDTAAWAAFARRLDPARFRPVIVPDTDTAMIGVPAEFDGLPWMAEAAFSLGLRLALYEAAYVNLLTSGGPILLCQYDDLCRYLYFKPLIAQSRESDLTSQLERGYHPNQSPPYSTPFQRWVWEDDRLEVIERSFGAMCALIEAAP